MNTQETIHEETLREALYARGRWAAVDGLFRYPAGLPPEAARRLLALLPPGRVLDPFMGGGAVALAARRSGRAFVGRDVSEAALCITRARCWLPTQDEASAYLQAIHDLMDDPQARPIQPDSRYPEPMGAAVQATLSSARPGRAQRLAVAAVRAWRAERDRVSADPPGLDLDLADARTLRLATPIDGALTSPPYPGVYDYDRWTQRLRAARGQPDDIDEEIGARRSFSERIHEATAAWREDTRAWTLAVATALRPGGRLVIVIGDGPRPDGPVDTRVESIDAAERAGLRMLAAATAAPGTRPSPRREHALLFERPAER